MNKLNTIILTLASMVSFCGCINEPLVQEASENSVVRIYADFAETRTAHASANGITSVSWVKGDMIGISTDKQMNLCYCANASGKSTYFSASDTELLASEGANVYAYYPYDWPASTEKSHIRLGNTRGQIYSRTLSEYDILYAEDKVIDNEVSLNFKHIYSILRVSVPTSMLVKDESSGYHILRLISNEPISILDGNFNIETKEFEVDYSIDVLYIIDEDITGEENVTFDMVMMPQSSAAQIGIYAWANNYSIDIEKLLYTVNAPKDGFQAGKVYTIRISEELIEEERAKSVAALTALYNSTNGDQWHRNDNWLSDEPLYKWYGLNANYWPESTIEVDDIVEIQLFDNNLRGTLPPEFAYIMSKARAIQIENNGLNGVIPQEVREHPKWPEFGWNVLEQNPWIGGGFDLSEGTGLVLPECEISFFVEDDIQSSKTVLSKNELTFVFNAGAVDMIEGISDERVNYYLGYKNKGLGIIATVGGYWDYPYDEYKDYVIERRAMGLPEDIGWAKDFQPGGGYGRMQLYDKKGNLIGMWMRDYGISETWFLEQMDVFVRKYLGEPEDHPLFITKYYTSTDYSRDGEVVTLQTATKGKGIDLVFMGDGYVDKQMMVDGKYEQDMRASMEYFFDVEPYKSFRDRFNVYAVKVISPNEEQQEGCQWRINYNDDICLEYAAKVDGIDLDKVTIVNVTNSPNPVFVSGYTSMYGSGASIAHIEQGGPSNIIVHEAGGHGFGKLLDEYIYGGFEDNHCPPENLESFKEWIRTDYHNKGWGVNIDTTDDPEKVIWSHFLKDDRYINEVGIWQGAWYWPVDLWRSSENSVMNSDYSHFNAPSREAIYKWIMQWSEGDGWEYDYEKFVEYDAINRSSVLTRSNYVLRQDNRKVNHHPPVIINGSPKANEEKDEKLSLYISR